MPAAVPYIELHAHSAFSFLDGASTPAELAGARGPLRLSRLRPHRPRRGLGLDGVRASPAGSSALRPITGAELTLEDGAHLTLLVESQAGYRNLCRLLTAAHSHTREGAQRAAGQPCGLARAGRGAQRGPPLPLRLRPRRPAGGGLGARRGARPARRWAGGCWRPSAATASGSSCSGPTGAATATRNRWLANLAGRLGVPTVATGNVHCHDPRRARLQDAFVAVRLGTTLEASEPGRRGNSSSALSTPRRMAERFAEHPEAVAETLRLAERLRFDLTEELGYSYPGAENPARRPRAGRGLPGAARGALRRPGPPPVRDEAEGQARAGAERRSATSASPASSSSTGRSSSWPARWRSRCGARSRRARSCPPAAAAAPASARSSAT